MVERPPDVPSQPEPEVRTTGTLHSRLPNANRIALEVGSAFVTMQQVVLRLLPKLRYACAAQIPSEPEYVWEVDQVIQQRAVQFVDAFNDLFDEALPRPVPENAAEFWMASSEWKTVGRCVRIGFDPRAKPVRHYHWAIDRDASLFHPLVREFWDAEIWTTDRYRTEQEAKGHRHS